jgi:signal transduction histidine kinase
MMKTPRISGHKTPALVDRLTSSATSRYGLAVASVVAACVVSLLIHGLQIGIEFSLLLLYGAILLTSVIGGLGPGLVATALSIVVGHLLIIPTGRSLELIRLGAEGGMLSIVGGTLNVARQKGKQRLKDNLRLEQQILEISDDERRRIGHDLHDGLGQHLTGISLLSEAISQQLEAGNKPDRATSETITELVSQSVQITRDLAKSLSPVTLEQDGLIAAIEELAGTSSTLFGINCRGEFDDEKLVLDRARSLHLYRIIQEAVNNSVRHGKARNVQINLRSDDKQLQIQVVDDGCGLSAKTMNNPGLGLRIMEYRARMLGAALMIERATEKSGTIVTCRCPVNGVGEIVWKTGDQP